MNVKQKIRQAAERSRGAPVRFVELYPIVETFRGAVVWEGVVSEFEGERGGVYAWAIDGGETVAVLKEPPANSPLDAVRVWLASLAHGKR